MPGVDHHDQRENPHRDDGEAERHGETTHDDPLTGTDARRRGNGSAGRRNKAVPERAGFEPWSSATGARQPVCQWRMSTLTNAAGPRLGGSLSRTAITSHMQCPSGRHPAFVRRIDDPLRICAGADHTRAGVAAVHTFVQRRRNVDRLEVRAGVSLGSPGSPSPGGAVIHTVRCHPHGRAGSRTAARPRNGERCRELLCHVPCW